MCGVGAESGHQTYRRQTLNQRNDNPALTTTVVKPGVTVNAAGVAGVPGAVTTGGVLSMGPPVPSDTRCILTSKPNAMRDLMNQRAPAPALIARAGSFSRRASMAPVVRVVVVAVPSPALR